MSVASSAIPQIQKGIEPINIISGAAPQYKSNLHNAIVNYIHNVNKEASAVKGPFGVSSPAAANTPGKDIVDKEKELFVVARTLDHNIPQKGDMYKMTTYIKDIILSMNSIYDALNLVAHPIIPALPQSADTPENVGAYANSLINSGKTDRNKITAAAATAVAATAAAAKAKTAAGAVDDPLIAEKCKGVYEISVWFGEPVNKKLFERLTLIHSLNSFEAAYIKLATNIFELTDDAAVPAVKPAGPAADALSPAASATGGAPVVTTAVPPPPPAPSAATVDAGPLSIAAPKANPDGSSTQLFTRTRPKGPPPPFPPNSAPTSRRRLSVV